MAIATDQLITKQDIIDRFHTRIKDFVATKVTVLPTQPFQNSVRVWNGTPGTQGRGSTLGQAYTVVRTLNTTAAAIAADSAANGGDPNATLSTGPTALITNGQFSDGIGASPGDAGEVANVLREFLKIYARVHYATFVNTGNLAPLVTNGVVSSSNLPTGTANLIDADVASALTARGVNDGKLTESTSFLAFIEDCRTIWTNRCQNAGAIETFKFSYCHSSCHSNVTCYSSRGRR
jgi:hypothetical protein